MTSINRQEQQEVGYPTPQVVSGPHEHPQVAQGVPTQGYYAMPGPGPAPTFVPVGNTGYYVQHPASFSEQGMPSDGAALEAKNSVRFDRRDRGDKRQKGVVRSLIAEVKNAARDATTKQFQQR